MDVTESYRILELEIGASRAEVDAAYVRLIEQWHPDGAAPGDPEAVREAQRMVQAINDAYHTLAKIAPATTKPSVARPTSAPSAPRPTSAPQTAPAKPKLGPLPPSQPGPTLPPPPRPPPAETWAARAAPSPASLPPSPLPPPPAPPPTKPLPAPPAPVAPTLAASAPPPAPTPDPAAAASTPKSQAKPSTPSISDLLGLSAFYDALFPVDSPRRRLGPVIVIAALILIVLLGKCALSSRGSSSKAPKPPDPKTTGSLVVKSNLAKATIEAKRLPSAGGATTASVEGAVDQPLSGLPPGKYSITAHAEGWPDVRGEANIDAEHTTEVALNFKGGSLRLNSDPEGATVRLGTAALGRTPLVIPQLPPGECQLSLEYTFWPVVPFKTTITENVESTGTVRLPHGKLTVETTPPGTMILLAGRPLGQTPLILELFPAGTKKLKLQAKNFPEMEIFVKMEDGGDVKVHPALGSVFPVVDPAVLLRSIWIPDNPDQIAPLNEGVTGPFQSRNGVVKNLNRKLLFENWMRKRYCFTGTVKAYDPATGQVEFVEQACELSRYRVLAILSNSARSDPDLTAQLVKGASFALYGRLSAVEEPRWLAKVITFELSAVEPLR
jgi:DnaJ domain/PEGA domain